MNIVDVYNIFKDYYGEDKVDLQGDVSYYNIIVHWPEVTVTNEEDEHIIIWDLYARIKITSEGKMLERMTFKRSTFNRIQWKSHYIHSHISYSSHDALGWHWCCTGTGPINRTIKTLTSEGNEEAWRMFVWELDKYVHIESLNGGPYIKIRNVYNSDRKSSPNRVTFNMTETNYSSNPIVSSFIKYTLEHNVLKISYQNNKYTLGENITKAWLDLSNQFIVWYNNLDNHSSHSWEDASKALLKAVYTDYGIQINNPSTSYDSDLATHVGEPVLTFKGQEVLLKDVNVATTPTKILVLKRDILDYIIYKLISYINLNYGRRERTEGN